MTMILAIILLFLVLVCVILLHFYVKSCLYCDRENSTGHQGLSAVNPLREGPEPSILKSIPVVVFSQKDFKDKLECVVCLCDACEGEKARVLLKCNHGFHVDCIDMWFLSHSTCPLCRNPVSSQSCLKSSIPEEDSSLHFPTNVLFWGNETHISALRALEEVYTRSQPPQPCLSSLASSSNNRPEGALVIDIPRQIDEEEQATNASSARLSKRLCKSTQPERFRYGMRGGVDLFNVVGLIKVDKESSVYVCIL